MQRLKSGSGDSQAEEQELKTVLKQLEEINTAWVDSKNEAWLNKKSAEHWQRIAVERLAEIGRMSTQSSPVNDNEPQVLTAGEPLIEDGSEEEAAVEEAIAPVVESLQLTRDHLGKQFNVSRETIRKWEETGKLADKGWEVVPGTGTNPKNPRLYCPIGTDVL